MSAPPTAVTVLVAAEDPHIRAIAQLLAARGFTTELASSGLEVISHVKRRRPDAIIVEPSLRRLGGLDTMRRIRAFDPSIRIIVIDAYNDEVVERRALDLGVHAVLRVPVDEGRLLAILRGPAPAIEPGVEAAPTIAARPAPPNTAAAKILIIEDDERVRRVIADMLATHGYNVRQAEDAPTGTVAISDESPDVIVLDICLPGLSGVEAFPAIRTMAPRAGVIMISGLVDEGVAKRALAFGAFDFLWKPVDLFDLMYSIEAALAMTSLEG